MVVVLVEIARTLATTVEAGTRFRVNGRAANMGLIVPDRLGRALRPGLSAAASVLTTKKAPEGALPKGSKAISRAP